MIKGLISAVAVVLIAIAAAVYYHHTTVFTDPAPKVPVQWWGTGTPKTDDTTVKPFKINFAKDILDDLNHRLNITRVFHPPLDGIGFQYGFNTKFLESVLDFWKTKYSWKERQDYLNSVPQFMTEVQGLKIHFIHVKPTKASGIKVIPLLLIHGWPGSVREFYSIIPKLTTPKPGQQFVFEVIAPSLPGYGFSQATSWPGLGTAEISVIFQSLMKQLGFSKFFIQGGDWGSMIAIQMAQLYPESVVGLHTNMANVSPTLGIQLHIILGSYFPDLVGVSEWEKKFTYPLLDRYAYILEESGYFHIQATKPDTIGVALRDSPIGLAAYILEKFSTWTNPSWKNLPDGGLLQKYKLEDLLDNVMLYWLTGSATSSMRIYSEQFSKRERSLGLDSVPVLVPTAIARFPFEIANQPRSILELKFKNLVQLSDFSTGGHFAAFEEPGLLADDIWNFAKLLERPKSTKNM